MPKLTVCTNEGIVANVIDLKGWNLDKAFARSALMDEIRDAIRIAERLEKEQEAFLEEVR